MTYFLDKTLLYYSKQVFTSVINMYFFIGGQTETNMHLVHLLIFSQIPRSMAVACLVQGLLEELIQSSPLDMV